MRRCRTDKWNYTAEDDNIFPIRLQEGGDLYGFCPSKATRDNEASTLFEIMIVAIETKTMLVSGGIVDQPHWFIALLSWFVERYEVQKFVSRAKLVLGDEDDKKAK